MGLTTYMVERMRVTRPTGKTAERHPDRMFAVSGTFFATENDAKGNLVRKDKLSIAVKYIDRADAEGLVIDTKNGILTLTAGDRGRKAAESISQDEINAVLAELATS